MIFQTVSLPSQILVVVVAEPVAHVVVRAQVSDLIADCGCGIDV